MVAVLRTFVMTQLIMIKTETHGNGDDDLYSGLLVGEKTRLHDLVFGTGIGGIV